MEFEKLIEILRERCISSGKRKQIIDGIRLLWIYKFINGMKYKKKNCYTNQQIDYSNLEQKMNNDRNWVYSSGKEIKFKITMLKSSLCDYSDAYKIVKGTILVLNIETTDGDVNNTNIKVDIWKIYNWNNV